MRPGIQASQDECGVGGGEAQVVAPKIKVGNSFFRIIYLNWNCLQSNSTPGASGQHLGFEGVAFCVALEL